MDRSINVVHRIGDDAELDKSDNPSFLLSNKKGGFLSLGSSHNITRHQGCYFLKRLSDAEWTLFKVIEDIRPNKKPTHLINNFYNIERKYDASKESFFMYNNSFVYDIEDYDGFVDVMLDCREIYDYDDKGRIYKISKKGDSVIVEYTKYIDKSLKGIKYRIFLVMKGVQKYEPIEEWCEKIYDYDKRRGTTPEKVYVYNALRIQVTKKQTVVFSYGDDLNKAIEAADMLDVQFNKLVENEKEYVKGLCRTKFDALLKDEKIKLAHKCCIKSLNDLTINVEGGKEIRGIFAGFPWFFQFWTRDEAISAGALICREEYVDAKSMLFRHIDNINEKGKLANKLPSAPGLDSADSTGWAFKRIRDLIEISRKRMAFDQVFSENDVHYLKDRLMECIVKLLKTSTFNALAHNEKLETWMDTSVGDDTREGFRIEVQALRLNMYRLMKELAKMTDDKPKHEEYKKLEQDIKGLVKESFWMDPLLRDGIDSNYKNDDTVRSNIFIAYYVYPELLSTEEWDRCFEYSLKKLWLRWGGVATIDRDSKLFCEEYSGEDNKSYHRGDSWFWINCIAAICMHRLDDEMMKHKKNKERKYRKYIETVIDACCNDILFKGFIGHHSELSSAKELRGEGNLCQAWSAAMFIELIYEAYFKDVENF